MADGKDRLHSGLIGQHVLVTGLLLDSFSSFLIAALLTAAICAFERLITFALSKHWTPFRVAPGRWSRVQHAIWRTGLFWIATFLRLMYMLIAMTFHIGLILVIVTMLAAGQFFIEYSEPSIVSNTMRHNFRLDDAEPLLSPTPCVSSQYDKLKPTPFSPLPPPRPFSKSKSKPSHIFIHPNHSNLARADAAAVELGLHGSTDYVAANAVPTAELWETGTGREAARQLMGTSRQAAHQRTSSTSSQGRLFRVQDTDSDSE